MPPIFTFPDDARWDEAADAVVFSLHLGEYVGKVILQRAVLQRIAGMRLSPNECLQQFHLAQSRFEQAAERRVRERALDDDANIRLTGRDLRRAAPDREQS
jgi:hypothetical protein